MAIAPSDKAIAEAVARMTARQAETKAQQIVATWRAHAANLANGLRTLGIEGATLRRCDLGAFRDKADRAVAWLTALQGVKGLEADLSGPIQRLEALRDGIPTAWAQAARSNDRSTPLSAGGAAERAVVSRLDDLAR